MVLMDAFIQQLLNGLLSGSLYALVALGYTMVYGILRIINFAHGDVLMIGALVGLSVIRVLQAAWPDMPPVLLLLTAAMIAMAFCAVLAVVIERVAYRRLRNAPRLAPLISGIGVSLLLQTVAMLVWTRNPQMFPQLLPLEPIEVLAGDATHAAVTNATALTTIGVALSLMLGLLLLVERTRFGRAMRAVAENPQVASLMGINPNRIIVMTFAIGGALAALAGIMMASNYGSAHFYMGFLPGIKAFTAAVLGGIGNLKGAMLGGLLLGLIEALGTGYLGAATNGVFGSNYQDVFAFIVLIAVLVLRPQGLLGERLATRA
ncbi:high-affinity branched-chain amino acid transport system permease protein LivH [Pseudomonas sp. DD1]|jgi:branched-chain amino acid transport system permease protein|uniref:Branched-chain amino acid ABC transporter permease n=2 Tax=Pseudomonas TaxID=286 RepID=A0ABT5N6V9_9PSED|nr:MULTISPECIES: branched-chain amino acid ABC transporter permease [Pseudomonas]SUD44207.1 HmgE [Pseudomonas fluorescens]MCM8563759.1 branched-chain amino acid ABC transporter permease [Pseudomonas shahriarae]MCU0213817.1 branched-chain amino acid ABC transporter permease [Pseudomonas shahriarae]MDD0977738.1 branched-chain amino acid ABC transporter permease [Pseudomonas shahriarae]MDD0984268.1 branched-chain amino acid ABC transporter permease [Pseudomonas shahriarae]